MPGKTQNDLFEEEKDDALGETLDQVNDAEPEPEPEKPEEKDGDETE
jgi:hypothetical protein